ncbi:type II secretion system F family protein [Planctomycetota bacterium]
MATYQYTIHSPEDNQVISSTCVADSPELVRTKLKRIGYQIDSIKPYTKTGRQGTHKRTKMKDLVNFCRRFSVMYAAGLPLMDCLDSLAQENESQALAAALNTIRNDIRSGVAVADAFGRHPKIFKPFFTNMLRAGEAAGKFDYVLSELADYLERETELKRSVRQALAYPITVVGMIFVVTTAIVLFVVPVFARVFGQMGITLPGPTVTLMLISKYAPWWISLLIVGASGLLIARYYLKAQSKFQIAWDKTVLSMALIGKVVRNVTLLRFIRTLAIMIKAGIPLEEAIALARDVAHSAVVTEAAHMMHQSIRRGGAIADAARLHNFFPPMIVQALAAGEESGNLHGMLERFAEGLEQDVDDSVKHLVSMIEPILVVVLSCVIGFILLAIYLPIFDLMQSMQRK